MESGLDLILSVEFMRNWRIEMSKRNNWNKPAGNLDVSLLIKFAPAVMVGVIVFIALSLWPLILVALAAGAYLNCRMK
jgi:hypothetical protein